MIMANAQVRSETYNYWRELYHLLSTLPLNDPEFRKSPETLAILKQAKWNADFNTLENYWKRVEWVSNSCAGSVLEVGSGMGNITRWIAHNPMVTIVVAVDVLADYIDELRSFNHDKVFPYCLDLNKNPKELSKYIPFDCVVLSEIVEHINTKEEIKLVRSIRSLCGPRVRWVLTTPIGFMVDPDHVRGFRRWHFRFRSKLLYGKVVSLANNSMQQFSMCELSSSRGTIGSHLCEIFVRLTDPLFEVRPSGHPWKYPLVAYHYLSNILRRMTREK